MPRMNQKKATKKRARKSKPMTPAKDKTGRWILNIPASKSEEGRRQRLYFKTKGAAELEAERIKGMNERWGSEAHKIKASLAEDAAKAMALLEDYDVTLTNLAQDYVKSQIARSSSITMAELWKRYEEHLEVATTKRGRPYSDRTKQTKRLTAGKIAENLGSKMVCDITADDLEEVLKKHFASAHSRNTCTRHAKPMFSWAVTKKYLADNPFSEIEIHATEQKDITLATPEQTLAALRACQDQSENKKLPENIRVDCSDAITAVSVLAFAGVRPERELPNLQWNHINLKTGKIRIKGADAKSRAGRYIPIESNLREWLELIPVEERQGSVAPANWKRKWQAVRKLAGFGRDADVFRHTYATCYHRGIDGSVDALRANLGHQTSDVVFEHYLDTNVEEEMALRYWQVTPDSLSEEAKLKTA